MSCIDVSSVSMAARRLTAAGLGVVLALASPALAQRDPGPRGGPPGAGGPYPGLSRAETQSFFVAREAFEEVDSVSGDLPGEPGVGLGPVFNGNSCAMCHAQPAAGGSSPGLRSPQRPMPNPQVALATLDGAQNTVPSFVRPDGPVLEPRFVASGTSFVAPNDGSVHEIYTITGRVDAPGCVLPQPDFEPQIAAGNVIFRIPSPMFGAGLVENTPDRNLIANLNATAARRAQLGILGEFNVSGNDQTIARFGWKAQNKSLEIFSGEAYNIEQGVTSELFQNEHLPLDEGGEATIPLSCFFNPTPEDHTQLNGTANPGASDVTLFGVFARLSAPPRSARFLSPSAWRGKGLFDQVGCALCHSPTLRTRESPFRNMSNVAYHPYSDFALHHMGTTLADGIVQGVAGPDQFRTAPLWGVGQRLFFLHDGRTQDLLEAIQAHYSPPGFCYSTSSETIFQVYGNVRDVVISQQFCNGSESNAVILRFRALHAWDQQAILDFLRSL